MDEVRSYVRLDLPFVERQGRPKDCSAAFSNPMMEDIMGRRRGDCVHRCRCEPMERPLNDFSRSLVALEPDGTLIAVIEMSLSSWLVAGIVPGSSASR